MALSPSVLYSSLVRDLLPHMAGSGLSEKDWRDPVLFPAESEHDAKSFAAYALAKSVFKKFKDEVEPDAAQNTIRDFKVANDSCENFCLDDRLDYETSLVVEYAKWILYHFTTSGCDYDFDFSKIVASGKFGPGSSLGTSEFTSAYFKIGAAPLYATSELLSKAYTAGLQSPSARLAEKLRVSRFGEIRIEKQGKLSLVPKSRTQNRVICVEAGVNTFFQLSLGQMLEDKLRTVFGIDFKHQPERNAHLAYIGSKYDTYATIDLKQCSDYLSMNLIESIAPRQFYDIICALRTSEVKYNDESIRLHMACTMGNGFCFPLQTLVLVSLVLGTYQVLGISPIRARKATIGNYGVFGDDIVLRKEAFRLLAKTLSHCGFTVNEDKSFSTGAFRESCGSDFFQGKNVRGVYIKTLHGPPDVYTAINMLCVWSAQHGISLCNFVGALMESLPRRYFVPPDEPSFAGIWLNKPPPGSRFGYGFKYLALKFVPRKLCFNIVDLDPEREVKDKRADLYLIALKANRVFVNEEAVMQSLLIGAFREGSLALRAKRPQFRLQSTKSPRWGFSQIGGQPYPGSPEYERWTSLHSWLWTHHECILLG